MTTLLHIDASAVLDGSRSRAASQALVDAQTAGRVIRRDLAEVALPQIDGAWVAARLTDPSTRSAEETEALRLSDELVAELQAADTIVIGTPIYNFGLPAALKAWIDLVARPRVTFRYTEGGPEGLLTGKRALIAVASGGTQVGGPGDFATPHLVHVLGFLGIDDVTVIPATEIAAKAA